VILAGSSTGLAGTRLEVLEGLAAVLVLASGFGLVSAVVLVEGVVSLQALKPSIPAMSKASGSDLIVKAKGNFFISIPAQSIKLLSLNFRQTFYALIAWFSSIRKNNFLKS
jgi:hypothetical protein